MDLAPLPPGRSKKKQRVDAQFISARNEAANATEFENARGFEVVQAANADETIEILTVRSDIHVVFTDIQMPGAMDGLKLARFVGDRWPPIRIVATSGQVRARRSAGR